MSDYAALAQRVSTSVAGIRSCLMLSRDGLVLGADPEGETEAEAKSAWLRFAALGEADRSYVEFPDRTWAFVRRGPYSAFAVADAGVRPGILVDLLEQALMAGEQERAQDREAMRLPEAPSAPSGKPRTSLHKPERAPGPVPDPVTVQVTPSDPERTASEDAEGPGDGSPGPDVWIADEAADPAGDPGSETDRPREEATPEPEPEPHAESQAHPHQETGTDTSDPDGPPEEESEVDRILLAKEFAGLLQVPKEDDEATR